MPRGFAWSVLLACALALLPTLAVAQFEPADAPFETIEIRPNYLPPVGVLEFLGVYRSDNGPCIWEGDGGTRLVEFRLNDAANSLILSGSAADVEACRNLISKADVPPRQIDIEVKIVEINQSLSRDIGLDWTRILATGGPNISWRYSESSDDQDQTRHERSEQSSSGTYPDHRVSEYWNDSYNETDRKSNDFSATSGVNLGQVMTILDETGTGTVRNAPRLLTLNNRRATILDGQRITYVSRYSSYTNLYVTDSMDAGVTLSVLPSVGESGYLTLDVRAELTQLLGDIAGSPFKDGQMIENTIIVKDGETVLIGGFQRVTEFKTKRRFPLLGHILPFLFSREITKKSVMESFIALTPHVVNLAVAVDPATMEKLEGSTDETK